MKPKISFLFLFIILSTQLHSQIITLSKIVNTHDNNDKFLYKLDSIQKKSAEYLGEIEIDGVINDEVSVFGDIYKKAKQLGANFFSVRNRYNILGEKNNLNKNHFFLSLYYMDKNKFISENNVVYLLSSEKNKNKIYINETKIELPPQNFIKLKLNPEKETIVSDRKFLGSTLKFTYQKDQKEQYFKISSFGLKPNGYGRAGINIKSADIVKLENSYGMFLTVIYDEFILTGNQFVK